jgi:hypothetical protein
VRLGRENYGWGNQRVAEHSESRLMTAREAVAIFVHEMFLTTIAHIKRKDGPLRPRRRGIRAGKHRDISVRDLFNSVFVLSSHSLSVKSFWGRLARRHTRFTAAQIRKKYYLHFATQSA